MVQILGLFDRLIDKLLIVDLKVYPTTNVFPRGRQTISLYNVVYWCTVAGVQQLRPEPCDLHRLQPGVQGADGLVWMLKCKLLPAFAKERFLSTERRVGEALMDICSRKITYSPGRGGGR